MRYDIPNIYRVDLNRLQSLGLSFEDPVLLICYGDRWFYWGPLVDRSNQRLKWLSALGTRFNSLFLEAWNAQREDEVSRLGFLIETGRHFLVTLEELDKEIENEYKQAASTSV